MLDTLEMVLPLEAGPLARFSATLERGGNKLEGFEGLAPETRVRNPDLTILCVPSSLESGVGRLRSHVRTTGVQVQDEPASGH